VNSVHIPRSKRAASSIFAARDVAFQDAEFSVLEVVEASAARVARTESHAVLHSLQSPPYFKVPAAPEDCTVVDLKGVRQPPAHRCHA